MTWRIHAEDQDHRRSTHDERLRCERSSSTELTGGETINDINHHDPADNKHLGARSLDDHSYVYDIDYGRGTTRDTVGRGASFRVVESGPKLERLHEQVRRSVAGVAWGGAVALRMARERLGQDLQGDRVRVPLQAGRPRRAAGADVVPPAGRQEELVPERHVALRGSRLHARRDDGSCDAAHMVPSPLRVHQREQGH